jgi:hypothetical protein
MNMSKNYLSYCHGSVADTEPISQRTEIPSCGMKIGLDGFIGCTSLTEIVFSSDSHLREIFGFEQSSSLCRIEIPLSVKKN